MTTPRLSKTTIAALCALSVAVAGCGASSSGVQSVPVNDGTTPGTDGGGTAADDSPGFAKFTSKCGVVPGVVGDPVGANNVVNYCVYENSPNPQMTLWFFHGLLDNETVFKNPDENHSSYREFLEGLPPVRIIMVSYGTLWLLSAQSSRTLTPLDGTVNVFRDKVVPFFEANYHPPKPWHVLGHSMGGFNTSVLCAAMPETWSKCVLLNAMIPSCDPFTGEFPGGLLPVGGFPGGINGCNPGPDAMVKDQFEAAQYAAAQPSALMSVATKLPRTFVSACKQDGFGLFTGPKAWSLQAQAKGFDVTFEPLNSNCDHYHWPAQRVIDFLR